MCVPACTCAHYFCLSFSLFERPDLLNTALCRRLLTHALLLYVDALQTFTWQRQWGQARGFSRFSSGGEACLHMWLSLWPLTLRRAVCNANKRRHPAGLSVLHIAPLTSSPPLSKLPLQRSRFPSRTVYFHRHISLNLWFKPETKQGLFLSLPLSTSSIL